MRSLPLSMAIVSDLLPRLARIRPSSAVTVAARTELTLTRVPSKRSWSSQASRSANWGCWVTEAPSNPSRWVATKPFSTAGIRPSSRLGVRNGRVR